MEADKPRSCGPHHRLWRIILRRRRLLSSTHAQASVLHACAAAEPLALPFPKCRTQRCCLACVGGKKSRCFRYSVTSSGEVDLSFPHQDSLGIQLLFDMGLLCLERFLQGLVFCVCAISLLKGRRWMDPGPEGLETPQRCKGCYEFICPRFPDHITLSS